MGLYSKQEDLCSLYLKDCLVQGCELELELELKELGNFGQTRTIKISELELEKSLWSLSSFNE